jgi:hypothetical protein
VAYVGFSPSLGILGLDGHKGRMAGNTRYFHVEKTIVKTLSS